MFDPNIKVLITDDAALSRASAEKQLRELGVTKLTQSINGEEAFKALEEAVAAKDPYQLVIIDWMMPVLDGVGLIKKIKASSWDPQPKLIMVTAESDVGQVAQAVKLGINAYVRKPLVFEEFKKAVERAMAAPAKGGSKA